MCIAQLLVLELGGAGLGYDDAQPCSMCTKVVCMAGLAHVFHTTQQGVARKQYTHNPECECEALDMLVT